MRGLTVVLCVAAAGNLVAAVANGLAGDATGTVLPAVLAVLMGFGAYRNAKHPPKPQPLTKPRIVVSLVLGGATTLLVLGALGWIAISVPDWPIRLVSIAGMVIVVGMAMWAIRTARRLDREARALTD